MDPKQLLVMANQTIAAAKYILESRTVEDYVWESKEKQDQLCHAIDMLVEALHDIQIICD